MLKNNFSIFSLVFLLVGMPIVYILREYIPISKTLFTYSILFIYLLGMIKIKKIINLKFYTNKPIFFNILLYSNFILFLIHALYSPLYDNIQTIFIIIILFFIFILSNYKREKNTDMIFFILLISSLTTYISLTLNTNEWVARGRFYVGDTHNPNITSFIALINIMSIFYYIYIKPKIYFLIKILLFTTAGLSFYLYLLSFSKSSILGLFTSSIFLFFLEKKILKVFLKKSILFIIIILPLSIIIFSDLNNIISSKITMLQYAYESYFYGTKGSMSAEIRHINLNEAFNSLHSISFFDGHGIYTTRADLPALQAFTDLGILSGIINLLVMLILPIMIVIKNLFILKSYKNTPEYHFYIFTILIFLFYFPNILLHGTPYEHILWLPTLMLYQFTPWKKNHIG